MDADVTIRAEELFLAALAQATDQRGAYLDQQCAGKSWLRREVETLLVHHAASEGFLKDNEWLPQRGSQTQDVSPSRDQPLLAAGQRIGSYTILGVLGSGGMGTVYRAEQAHPKREVALKVIRAGAFSASALRRFEHEVRLLGCLQHPGIAQIFEAGTHDDGQGPVPYFAMEHIADAKAITAYADERDFDLRRRLELFSNVCDAVHHGHQKGIIHRDLKPSNILVDASGQPKVIDFGVARSTDSDLAVTMRTDVGQLIGTLQYMSPEQCAADPAEIDSRSDVYALGVVLYELLGRRLPYDLTRKALPEAVRIIREAEPEKLSGVHRTYRGDVETIVAKALEKDKSRRYASASELSADLQRYLRNEAIIARPPSARYQLQKFAQRNRALVTGVAGAVLALLAGTIVSTGLAFRAISAERVATAEAVRADQTSAFIKTIFQGIDPYEARGRDTTLLMSLLSQAESRISSELAEQPLAEADIRATLGTAYKHLDRYDEADQNFRRSEQLYVEHLGSHHPSTARLRALQVDLLMSQGRHEQASSLASSVAADIERVLGKDAPETLHLRGALGHCLARTGRYFEAESIQRDNLSRRVRLFGEQNSDVAEAMQSLAFTLVSKGQFDEAERLMRKVIELRTTTLGSDHHLTLEATALLALATTGSKRFDEAVSLHETAISGFTRLLGPQNSRTLSTMSHLAVTLQEAGRYSEAEAVHRRTFEARRQALGETHSDTLVSKSDIAKALRLQWRFREAELLVRDVLETQKRTLGDDHRDTHVSMQNLALCLDEMGRPAEAATLLGEKVASYRRLKNESDPDLHIAMYNWAAKLEDSGKREAAEPVFQEVLGLHEKYRGRDKDYIAAANNGLAVCLDARGDHAGADAYFRRGLDMRRRLFGDTHRELAYSLGDFGNALMGRGDYSLAETYLRDSMRISEAIPPPGNHHLAISMNLWGRCRARQGAFTEGEGAMLAANAILCAGEFVHKDQTLDNLSWLVELYEHWDAAEPNTGKAEKAAEWRSKLQAFKLANID